MKFYVTFGQISAAKDGAIEVEAPSELDVRLYANDNLNGTFANWCSVYTKEQWEDPYFKKYYPLGVLRSIEIGPQHAHNPSD